ncbi:hypothetical protein ABZ342_41200 [Amycolatopsis sp. NPDC005961]|uniref:hypothetical protein n=1 Tax=Amycolatopsis sp. NPDC005961 TaxID=3156720 RepID=UPI0033E4A856
MTVDTGQELGGTIPRARVEDDAPRLEPMLDLEWSRAIDLPQTALAAATPAELRRAWVHRAPEDRVLALFRASAGMAGQIPAPWWLRAVAVF